MKDCEHVLGYFVEALVREETYEFTRDKFLRVIMNFCNEQVIDVDADVLFDILHSAHVVVSFGSEFRFKFTSWLFYFAAHRMHHDNRFSEFMLANMRYARSPEVIEFYTGVDRQRRDAVKILTKDVRGGISAIRSKCGLPTNLNPLTLLEWKASPENLQRMQDELRDGVADSNLPAQIKDRYADRDYNRSLPYCQSIREVLTGHTMHSLMLSISAASRALRNSDYVVAPEKHKSPQGN